MRGVLWRTDHDFQGADNLGYSLLGKFPRQIVVIKRARLSRVAGQGVFMSSEVQSRCCRHDLCSCEVSTDTPFCSEACQITAGGFRCPCEHLVCYCAAPEFLEKDAQTFYAGRLL